MRVDLDGEGAGLEGLPRFQRAAFHARRLLRLGYGLAGLSLLGVVLALFVMLFSPATLWSAVLINNVAALWLLVAGLQSAYWVARWRANALATAQGTVVIEPLPIELEPVAQEPPDWYERLLNRIGSSGLSLLAKIGLPTLWLGGWALLAILGVDWIWNLSLPGSNLGPMGNVAGAITLLLAFGLLVLERQLTHELASEWPEAAQVAQLARVAIACLLLSALCLFFSTPDRVWPARLAVLIGLLPGLVALELLLRAVASLFSPRSERVEPRPLASSFVAGLLRWPPQPLLALQNELHNRFGIDLRQIWAFTYMRRAFLPVMAVVLGLGWILTGVHEIPMEGRGIYERFGKPVEVFGPGLHGGLPWPFGLVRAVENGVVHELATSVSESNAVEQVREPAEGPAPLSANRLWDATHINDKSQVIASSASNKPGDPAGAQKQSFQIVNMDVRFVYRIGLTDQAALAATYNSADVPT
ncbi:MAG: hypothetical protein JWP42_688, partial [Pseudomonas sp.]|nr:hypothetical protein [Pseudomonas sp.]